MMAMVADLIRWIGNKCDRLVLPLLYSPCKAPLVPKTVSYPILPLVDRYPSLPSYGPAEFVPCSTRLWLNDPGYLWSYSDYRMILFWRDNNWTRCTWGNSDKSHLSRPNHWYTFSSRANYNWLGQLSVNHPGNSSR